MGNSPFSLAHDWTLHWKRDYSRGWAVKGESPIEQKALQALGAVGIIGGFQLLRLFLKRDKNRRRKIVQEKKIIRHEVQKGNQCIPIYTLGINGAAMASMSDYKPNYWVNYTIEDVLKRLLFFQLYEKFPDAHIVPAPAPFVGAVSFKSNLLYVYVVRGDMTDLLMHLKWNRFAERLIIVTESLNHLQPLNVYASDLKIRVTTDDDLRGDFQNLFYFWDGNDNDWVKENRRIAHMTTGG